MMTRPIYFTRDSSSGGQWQHTRGSKIGGLKQVAVMRGHDQIGRLEGDVVHPILTNVIIPAHAVNKEWFSVF